MIKKSQVLSPVMAMAGSVVSGAKASINSKGELLIYGVIGEWWDDLDAETVVRQAEEAGDGNQLVVRVHSEGGSVVAGLAIYNALKRSEREVVVYVDGIAASMASAVVAAADVVRMPANALMMLHKPHLVVQGNANDLRDTADQVDVLEASYISCYAQKSNQTAEQLTALISDGKDHWLTAQQCVDMGLCDEIIGDIAIAASYNPESFHNPPSALWSGLATVAAVAAKPLENNTMKFKVIAKNGGSNALVASIMAMLNKMGSVDSAVAKLVGIENAEALVTGAAQASAQQLNTLAQALGVSEPEPVAAAQASAVDAQAAADRAVASERQRVTDITAMGRKYGLGADVVASYISDGVTLASARDRALDVVAERTKAQQPAPGVRVTHATADAANAAMSQALLNRFNPSAYALDDNSKQFAHQSLLELARAHLHFNGVDTTGKSSSAIATQAMSGSSDFPAILADVANKTLRAGYEAAPRTFTAFSRRTTAKDFKDVRRAQLDSAGGSLNKLNEHGEYRRGKLVDGSESYSLATYGEIIALTRQTLINDDLDALSRVPMMQGYQVAETESELVWALILQNAAMSDGKGLFHADHGNLGSGAIGKAGLTAMRKKMRTQTKLDGKTPINLAPQFMVVPAALETTAQEYLTAITANQASSVNPFANSMQLLVEARLDAVSETEWYAAADPNRIDTIEYAYLEGEEGAYMETRQGFDVDGVELKVRLDFGAGVIDHRGLYKSTGA